MLKKLFVALLAFPLGFGIGLYLPIAKAGEVSLTRQGITITLFDTSCEVKEVIEVTALEYQNKLHGGVATFPNGEKRQLCWAIKDKKIYILDQYLDGPDPIAVEEFKPSEQKKQKERKTI